MRPPLARYSAVWPSMPTPATFQNSLRAFTALPPGVLRDLHDLLEGGAVLEREVGHVHAGGDREPVHVEARCLGLRAAVGVVAVERGGRDLERARRRGPQRGPAAAQRAPTAVGARVAALDRVLARPAPLVPLAPLGLPGLGLEHPAQVLAHVTPPAVEERGRGG